MLTEHEAKQRWCPFARVGVTEAVGSHACNRTPLSGIEGLNGANLCIGAACMAWRWMSQHGPMRPHLRERIWKAPPPRKGDTAEPPRPLEVPPDAVWHPGGFDGPDWIAVAYWEESKEAFTRRDLAAKEEWEAKYPEPSPRGVCGLAGRPQ